MSDLINMLLQPWVIIAVVSHVVILGAVAYVILLERKVASWVQDRIGPNRVGPLGLLQPIADGLKFLVKEDYRPKNADRKIFNLAPMVMVSVAIISIAVIPWGGIIQQYATVDVTNHVAGDGSLTEEGKTAVAAELPWLSYQYGEPTIDTTSQPGTATATVTYRWHFQAAQLNIGVLFVLAVLSMAVYGVVLGGWASNNKYSFFGGIRACANMLSYEIPLAVSVLVVVLMAGTLELGTIVEKQSFYWAGWIPAWNVFCQPLTFILFLICIHAEANRAPFDMPEAEQELVGGYHTEYSSMRFALFFLAEYAGMITTSAICVALFFGGWHFPGLEGAVDSKHPSVTESIWLGLLRAGVFFLKTILIIFIFMWVRWSLPRFRFDQLMVLAWRALIPMSLGLLLMTTFVVYFFGMYDPTYRETARVTGGMAIALLAGNAFLWIFSIAVSAMLPDPLPTNRRVRVRDSRFKDTPVPVDPPSTASSPATSS